MRIKWNNKIKKKRSEAEFDEPWPSIVERIFRRTVKVANRVFPTTGSGCDAVADGLKQRRKRKHAWFRWWTEHDGAFIATYGGFSVKIETKRPLDRPIRQLWVSKTFIPPNFPKSSPVNSHTRARVHTHGRNVPLERIDSFPACIHARNYLAGTGNDAIRTN